ncbi:MAG: exodeoxyribonuclease VII large subunit [Deltaproteobacteria bacterium]|nr:exodeoxyribonuclease VII large subunit [Candidatus Tharpella sp.]
MGSLNLPDEFWLEDAGLDDEPDEDRHIYSVSQLTGDIRLILEDNFTPVWVEGEISTLRTPASGHTYFTLKDERAQLKAVLFRRQQWGSQYQPQEGDRVLCSGRISLYEPRGEYQVIVTSLELQGLGGLWRAFTELKNRLEREGLFKPERKKKIPLLPRTLALITSATGAAVHDILQVIRRRFAGVEIIIVPVTVQGERAAGEIVAALKLLDNFQQKQIDTVILTRGGCSYEDLQPFNDERVARAIAACSIPLISAVGHEIDFTIADFVADLRAPTPSAAAELVIANHSEMVDRLHHLHQRLSQIGRYRMVQERRRLQMLALALERGGETVVLKRQEFSELKVRFRTAMLSRLRLIRQNLEIREYRLTQMSPLLRIKPLFVEIDLKEQRLVQAIRHFLSGTRQRVTALSDRLKADSPLAVLARGYTVVEKVEDDKVVRKSSELVVGDQLHLRLHQGEAWCRVEKVMKRRTGEDEG